MILGHVFGDERGHGSGGHLAVLALYLLPLTVAVELHVVAVGEDNHVYFLKEVGLHLRDYHFLVSEMLLDELLRTLRELGHRHRTFVVGFHLGRYQGKHANEGK